ncbi:hypothetical protein Microterr_18090 [Microbacterium terricola]|uniref:DUF559 domain-containing protein n=1 Tax=Microbacterium terricola TaxID=344163 RepID=A0ABM8DZX3_9MICO|nr:hypothetical protein Microterr_18090 [Microbacterium terricola]
MLGDRFRVADALRAGAGTNRLRKPDLDRPFHGVRALRERASTVVDFDAFGQPRGELERRHLRRAFDYSVCMTEHEFFCHTTAAVIWGLPLPPELLRAPGLDVAVLAPRRLPRGVGIRGHQAVPKLTRRASEPRSGLSVTSPATTWAMLARTLRDPRDLVAVGDAVVREWRVAEPLATRADLEAALAAGRRIGIGRLREALPYVRTGSASRPETRTRLELIDAGLPEPSLNFDIYVDDVRLACVDLAYPALKIAIEYEGEHHLLSPAQWARDIERYDRLRAAGWCVIRVTKIELFSHPDRLVRRVAVAIASRR